MAEYKILIHKGVVQYWPKVQKEFLTVFWEEKKELILKDQYTVQGVFRKVETIEEIELLGKNLYKHTILSLYPSVTLAVFPVYLLILITLTSQIDWQSFFWFYIWLLVYTTLIYLILYFYIKNKRKFYEKNRVCMGNYFKEYLFKK